MTEQERIIVSAYTGYVLCDFNKVHEYIEKKMGRPVWTHEFASKELWEEIRDRCREDFIALADKEKQRTVGQKQEQEVQDDEIKLEPCPFCGSTAGIEEMAMPEGLRYAARCRDDSGICRVIPTTGLCLSPKDAAEFWNWRHE